MNSIWVEGAERPSFAKLTENIKTDVLIIGGAHRTGKKGGARQELVAFARAHYGKAKLVCQWATQDCMTLDQVPYIGQYSKSTPNLYVATGFNKWGMTSSMVAAKLLTDLLLGKENDYAAVFSPSRSVFRPQLAINVAESLLGLLTPTVPRCPHLGCALKYNPYEHTWDCFVMPSTRCNKPRGCFSYRYLSVLS